MTVQTTPLKPVAIQRSWHWARVWMQAVFRPSVRTFEHIFADSNAQYSRAYLWVFTSVFLAVGAGVTLVLLQGNGALAGEFSSLGATYFFGVLPAALLIAIFGGGAWVLLTELWVAALDWLIGRAPDDNHAYTRLLYAFSAFLAPLVAISALVALFASFRFPALYLLQAAICLYALVLAMLAARAVYQASWTRTILCTLIGAFPVALALMVATMVIGRWAAAF